MSDLVLAAGGPWPLAWCVAVIFAAYALRGATGFGAGVVAIPLLLLVLPLPVVIPLVTALGMLASFGQALHQRRHVHWAGFHPLVLPTLAGVGAGLWLFSALDSRHLLRTLELDKLRFRATVSVALLCLSALRALGYGSLGLYDARVLWLLAAAVPVVAVAMVAGDRWHARLDEARFGHLVAALLALSGVALLFK